MCVLCCDVGCVVGYVVHCVCCGLCGRRVLCVMCNHVAGIFGCHLNGQLRLNFFSLLLQNSLQLLYIHSFLH